MIRNHDNPQWRNTMKPVWNFIVSGKELSLFERNFGGESLLNFSHTQMNIIFNNVQFLRVNINSIEKTFLIFFFRKSWSHTVENLKAVCKISRSGGSEHLLGYLSWRSIRPLIFDFVIINSIQVDFLHNQTIQKTLTHQPSTLNRGNITVHLTRRPPLKTTIC